MGRAVTGGRTQSPDPRVGAGLFPAASRGDKSWQECVPRYAEHGHARSHPLTRLVADTVSARGAPCGVWGPRRALGPPCSGPCAPAEHPDEGQEKQPLLRSGESFVNEMKVIVKTPLAFVRCERLEPRTRPRPRTPRGWESLLTSELGLAGPARDHGRSTLLLSPAGRSSRPALSPQTYRAPLAREEEARGKLARALLAYREGRTESPRPCCGRV